MIDIGIVDPSMLIRTDGNYMDEEMFEYEKERKQERKTHHIHMSPLRLIGNRLYCPHEI